MPTQDACNAIRLHMASLSSFGHCSCRQLSFLLVSSRPHANGAYTKTH